MEWFALSTRRMRDPDYLRLPAELRGHHASLLALLAERERGPVLHGALKWSRRDWDRACACTMNAIHRLVEAGLCIWSGEDLQVMDYDSGGESRVRTARESGRKGGISKWSHHSDPSKSAKSDPTSDPSGEPTRVASTRDGTVRNGTRRDVTGQEDSARAAPEVSASAIEVSTYLLEAIRSHKPDAADGSASWAKDIDKAMRIDGRTPERLRAVIDFAHRSSEQFWRANLLSGASLRKHVERLEIQAAAPRGGAKPVGIGGRVFKPNELAEYARDLMEQERKAGLR